MTLGSSSPLTPSLRGLPDLPSARMTWRARCWPLPVVTVKMPSSSLTIFSTFSPVLHLKSARFRHHFQNSRSCSLESSVFLNLPCMGNSTGLVMTSFWRGYLATVPPISDCSRVR